ncbi:mitochondrial ribosomal protein subunit L31 [Schizosaccharomyces pombe]|uniref:Large ribosomal subunit protein bL31m n=1 Tax=Schizosaccharomyces pombe (strain 972 / ATCC 24843) TaxID=284812 RepID=RM36_SCHPO|nr:YmL36-like mitochondrial ribosomal protein tam9 [Schizosaccharomyces pombe]G2TRQ8.1 RecName: Full=Large ribosomal subunit protein bL31m; AltName: Full=54S ribosomal protein L36, mitochondrial; AltName: Full=Transcripts altered in meiosis protein 9; Flags: Precursor [Schizosaccharomyces pombe 972h-]CCD31368.1 mitochondrial ribosomal protein subunit L36, MrpL36/YmL36 (product) [Schizosaccharomyces pombe]|eukprot:NP_001343158.1 YmL36-like mitochondrial ribosomal protein tam9 [Schizosaccharomyces pombe]
MKCSLRLFEKAGRLSVRSQTVQTFQQRIVLANGASYLVNTTLPKPYILSIKDITNMPLNNPKVNALSSIRGQESRRSKFEERYEGL